MQADLSIMYLSSRVSDCCEKVIEGKTPVKAADKELGRHLFRNEYLCNIRF